MLTNHQITALVLGVLLPMILLLLVAYACGINKGKLLTEAVEFSKGYQAGLAKQSEHIAALHSDIEHLHQANQAMLEAHRVDRDNLIQDADKRIAFYSKRSNPLNASDLITLEGATRSLSVARQTWLAMGANDAATTASQQEYALCGIRARLMDAINTAAAQPVECEA